MATIYFNATNFRALFPAFANSIVYPDFRLQVYWDSATSYITDRYGGWYNGLNLKQQTLALNLMTAHLLYLSSQIAADDGGGGAIGIETSASIDKISVAVQPPPAPNQWQYWLNTSAYGQQLLALLEIAAAGGRFYNPVPVFPAFRR